MSRRPQSANPAS